MNLNLNSVFEIFDIIDKSDSICIAGHKAPDGDCIGSVMALYEFLKPMNKKLTVCIDGSIPYNYKAFVDEAVICKEYVEAKYDVVVVLDCSDKARLGVFEGILNNAKKTICIDHHKTNASFADINIIDPYISSTGELLYDIIKTQGKNISKKTAEYIYLAIITDTGNFSYSNTNSKTHITAAELMEIGVNISDIHNTVYNSKPSKVVKAFTDCISGIELFLNNKIGVAVITKKILDDNQVEMGDIDGVVEFIREIKEVQVACVLKEYVGSTKVSLRSKGDMDVSEISLLFNGGGHKRAAGFEVNDNIENTKKIIINELKKHIGE